MYTVGSLFAGIGGIDLAFTWAGYRIAWQVELDDYARSVLARHWPDVPRYRDVRGVTGRSGKGWRRYQRLEPVDVMVGGFPCQDISVAGRGAGILAGTRSGLWFEFARLIGELRPRLVLLENVAAITIRDGEVVIGSLAEMGYDARWGTIRASDAGAPHQRERWFCVAYSDDGRYKSPDARKRATISDFLWIVAQEELRWHKLKLGTGEYSAVGHTANQRRQRNGSGREQEPGVSSGQGLSHGAGCGVVLDDATRGQRYDVRGKQPQEKVTRDGTGNRARSAQPRLGRAPDGLPAGLDAAQWPAPPGPRFSHEPPRVASGTRNRAARLRALGNAVVPDVVYPIAVAMREWLDKQTTG